MYRLINDIGEARKLLSGAKVAAFDFETAPNDPDTTNAKAALDAHQSHIVGVSFSVMEGDAIYIPIAHKNYDGNVNPDDARSFLAEFAADTSLVKVAHNLAFESAFLYAMGIVIQQPCYDTIAAAQLTLCGYNKFRKLATCGLKRLVPELYDIELPSFDEVTGGRWFDALDPNDYETIRYACADSDYTLRLYHTFNGWFGKFLPAHRRIVEEIESPTAVYCGIMHYNGLLVDEPLMYDTRVECEQKRQSTAEAIAAMTGNVDIGANASTKAFKEYLFKTLNLPAVKTTMGGKAATDDEALIQLSEYCVVNRPDLVPLFKLVQEYRAWGKIISTYIDGYVKYINPMTGRIHPDFLPLEAVTGRFASRNPNCQNCPQVDNDPAKVRNFIVASPGNVLLSLDFSQIELRVGAFYCRDETMMEVYRTGGDIHAATTAVIYRIPIEEAMDKSHPKYKERRTVSKNVNFGTFYGIFERGLYKTLHYKAGLDTPLSECAAIIKNLKAGYPGIAKWQEKVKEDARRCKHVKTGLGRRRYIPDIDSEDWGKRSYCERVAMNLPVQGLAADILKLALGRIIIGLPSRPWLRPLLQIHDELAFEVPEDKVAEAVAFIKLCMEAQPFDGFDVPIVAEASVGRRFGAMKELHEYANTIQ